MWRCTCKALMPFLAPIIRWMTLNQFAQIDLGVLENGPDEVREPIGVAFGAVPGIPT